jgi:hypothetical protein
VVVDPVPCRAACACLASDARACGVWWLSDDDDPRNAEPNKVDAVVSASQIATYCDQMSRFSKNSSSRLFLVGSLHKESAN